MSERGGIVVLDFGGQYTQLIARRIREQQVFSAILPCTASLEQIRTYEPTGIVLSGGPNSVYDAGAPPCDPGVLSMGVAGPGYLLWVAVDDAHSGRARGAGRPPGIWADRTRGEEWLGVVRGPAAQTANLELATATTCERFPPGFHVTGETGNAVSAAEDPARKLYAVQFHPEVRHTDCGSEILRNFVFDICHARPLWSGAAFIAETVESIRKQVGEAQGDLRLERRSGFGCRGSIGAPRHRGPPDEHLRR